MRKCLIILSFILTGLFLRGQESGVYFRNYASEIVKTEQGLSQNSVRSIMQDSHGLMWFGTWDGLNMFNGLKFEIYRSDYSGKPGQLSNHTVNAIYEDRNGIFWLGTDRGLNRFDPYNETYRAYFHDPSDHESLSNDTITDIVEDREGNLWIATQCGLNRLVDTSGKFIHFNHMPQEQGSISCNEIRDLFSDSNGNLWISTANGLNKWIPGFGQFLRITSAGGDAARLADNGVNCVEELADRNIIAGTDNGISILDPAGKIIRNLMMDKDNELSKSRIIMDFCVEDNGRVWIATSGGGIYFYYPEEDRYESLDELPAYSALNEEFVNEIYKDRQGIIWIGYAWKGLGKFVPSKAYFTHYKTGEGYGDGLPSNSVWSVVEEHDDVYFIGTDRGISKFDRKNKRFTTIDKDDGLSSNNIRAMLKDRSGNIWIGTLDQGLMKYNPAKKSWDKYGNNNRGFFSDFYDNEIWALLQDHDGRIWVGTFNGLYSFYPDSMKKSFSAFRHDPGNPESISHDVIYSLYEDINQNIWVGTYGGLNKTRPGTGKFKVYKHKIGDAQSISTNKVFALTQDTKGFLWIGTMGGGLNRMNPYTGKFRHYVESDGLANNVVYNIIIDELGYLWMSTNKGLSKFDPESETFINYDINDGIQSYEFNLGAAYKSDEHGYFFFGGMNGFNIFQPSNIRSNQQVPKLVVTGVRVYNNEIPGMFFDGDTIVLSHSDNFFSIEFAALDYSNPAKNQYKYKLEDISSEWISTKSGINLAEFTELRPGKYVFHLQGSNSDGIWNEQGLRVHIIVKPAWYQTAFFQYGIVFLIALVLYLLISGRIRRIRKGHQTESQLFDLERKALRLQMNPHFIFNTLNSIQNYILEHNKTSAISYLNKFSKMMRQVLYNSDKSIVPLSDEISLLRNYIELERLRFGTTFDYSIQIDEEIEEDFIGVPPMLIQPHVENAILHGLINLKGRKGKLDIIFRPQSTDTILCIVEDNGIGREASRQRKLESKSKHKSRGVRITEQRLEKINHFYSKKLSVNFDDKYDDKGKPAGTMVTIIIPVEDI